MACKMKKLQLINMIDSEDLYMSDFWGGKGIRFVDYLSSLYSITLMYPDTYVIHSKKCRLHFCGTIVTLDDHLYSI